MPLSFSDKPADPAEYLPPLPEAATGAEISFHADETAPEAGPGGTPKITIALTTEITGEWVTNEQVAYAAEQLAASMGARLREAAHEGRKEGM
jgi:hypothetical protein